MEQKFKVELISGIDCPKNGKHYEELVCVNDEGKVIRIVVEVTNQCPIMCDPQNFECQDCEEKDHCEICEPAQIQLGGMLLIVDKGEVAIPKQTEVRKERFETAMSEAYPGDSQ